jgi:hypothetical protein
MTQAIRVLTEFPADQNIRNGGTGNWSAASKGRHVPES